MSEQAIRPHEEAADAFILATGIVLLIGGVSVRGGVGSTARAVSAAGTLAILGFGYNMGHTGGELVFRDGAASAYTANGAGTPGGR